MFRYCYSQYVFIPYIDCTNIREVMSITIHCTYIRYVNRITNVSTYISDVKLK